MPSFLRGKSRSAFRQPAFFLAGNRMTIVAFEKGVSLKTYSSLTKRLYEGTEVLDKKNI